MKGPKTMPVGSVLVTERPCVCIPHLTRASCGRCSGTGVVRVERVMTRGERRYAAQQIKKGKIR